MYLKRTLTTLTAAMLVVGCASSASPSTGGASPSTATLPSAAASGGASPSAAASAEIGRDLWYSTAFDWTAASAAELG